MTVTYTPLLAFYSLAVRAHITPPKRSIHGYNYACKVLKNLKHANYNRCNHENSKTRHRIATTTPQKNAGGSKARKNQDFPKAKGPASRKDDKQNNQEKKQANSEEKARKAQRIKKITRPQPQFNFCTWLRPSPSIS